MNEPLRHCPAHRYTRSECPELAPPRRLLQARHSLGWTAIPPVQWSQMVDSTINSRASHHRPPPVRPAKQWWIAPLPGKDNVKRPQLSPPTPVLRPARVKRSIRTTGSRWSKGLRRIPAVERIGALGGPHYGRNCVSGRRLVTTGSLGIQSLKRFSLSSRLRGALLGEPRFLDEAAPMIGVPSQSICGIEGFAQMATLKG